MSKTESESEAASTAESNVTSKSESEAASTAESNVMSKTESEVARKTESKAARKRQQADARIMKQQTDTRIKKKHFSWKAFLLTYVILAVLAAGQWLIYAKYVDFTAVPVEFIFGMAGYWALVAGGFALVTHFQIRKQFDRPILQLSKSAKEVAGGDFSICLEPIHRPEKYDYIDAMFEDFNTMVEELGSTETLKSDFIANVSHEIKTPLAVIQSYATAMKKEDLPLEQRREYADTIVIASESLTELVSNILKLNKLENQEITNAGEDYDLCRQLSECALAFEDAWEEKGIEFEATLEDRVLIHADESMMEIVWHNLFSNAVKFTPPGGRIVLTQTSDERAVTVSVADNGPGMTQETIKHCFDKFYQGDTSHSHEGNGLGLALAKRVLEIAGGTMAVQSEPGAGTTFTVTLKTARSY